MKLRHVALTVRDFERSATFYGEHFGLTDRVHEDGHLLILADSAGGILAFKEGEPPVLPNTNHFGFEVTTPDEVDRACERFRSAGLTELEYSAAGPTRVQILDPDGYAVEVYSF